jgi:hypothetical protein
LRSQGNFIVPVFNFEEQARCLPEMVLWIRFADRSGLFYKEFLMEVIDKILSLNRGDKIWYCASQASIIAA